MSLNSLIENMLKLSLWALCRNHIREYGRHMSDHEVEQDRLEVKRALDE